MAEVSGSEAGVGSAVGIDVGSTNVKAVLLDAARRSVATAVRPLTWHRDGPVAEQDAEALWVAVVDALAELAHAASAAGHDGLADVATIGVCGQYSSIVPVDADNAPVAPMRLYLDQRGTEHCLAIMGREPAAFMAWIERHPVPPVGGGLALGHLLSFQHDSPEVHGATAAYLEPVDYVTARLTGTRSATQGSVFASQLVDNRRLGVTGYDFDLLGMAGVDASRLPPLVAPDAVVGTVRADVAASTGLPATAQVRAGMTDTQAAALATGVSSGARGFAAPGGRLGIAIGTTSVVLASTRSMAVDLDHEVLSMPGVSPDHWLVWAENGLAGRAVEHVMGRLLDVDHRSGGAGSRVEAAHDPFDWFDGALAASPPGAKGLLFLPWLSGSMAPKADSSVRGGFVGMSLDTDRDDMVRAAAEGVAHNLRWLLAPVEEFTGTPCTELVLVGGATRSPQWCQAIADVLGRPVRTVADAGHAGARAVAAWSSDPSATSAQGASAQGGYPPPASSGSGGAGGAGGSGDVPSPGNSWGERYEPDPALEPVHADAHRRFVAAFDALRPLSPPTRSR